MSVTFGQYDARPTVTFPAAKHHRPLTGTKLYCLVTVGLIMVIMIIIAIIIIQCTTVLHYSIGALQIVGLFYDYE